jgi:hypothetical protein
MDDFRRLNAEIVHAAGRALSDLWRAAALLIDEFARALASLAERAYLQHHRRLPGSTRTARLRKKRRTKVLEWFAAWLAANPPKTDITWRCQISD